VLPTSQSTIFDMPYFGASGKFYFSENWAVGLDCFYAGRKYFFYDQPGGYWYGPTAWDAGAAGTAGVTDWIFYQDKILINFLAYFMVPLGDFTLSFSTGPALLPTFVSDAALYYPDFTSAFDFSQSQVQLFIGYIVKTGAELRLLDFLSVTGDLMFEVDRPMDFFRNVENRGINYILACSNLSFGVDFDFTTETGE
jgi:hypothetical protein